MTKAELVSTISNKLGTEKNETQKVVEAFMQEIRTSMYNGGRYNQKIFSVICIFGLTDIQHCKKHHKRQKHHCYVI